MKKASKNFIYSLSKEFGKRCADIWDTEKQIFFHRKKVQRLGCETLLELKTAPVNECRLIKSYFDKFRSIVRIETPK